MVKVELGDSYPLVFCAADPADQRSTAPVVDQVLDHRSQPVRGLEFWVHWLGREKIFTAWEPAGSFVNSCPDPWLSYCREKGLHLDVLRVVESIGKAPDLCLEPPEESE